MSRKFLAKTVVIVTFAVVASAAGFASYQVGVGGLHADRQAAAPVVMMHVKPADSAAPVDTELFVPTITPVSTVTEPRIVILKTKPADPAARVDAELFAVPTMPAIKVLEAKR